MIAYIIRRLMLLPITVVGVTILIFGMLQLLSPVERSALYVRDIPHTEGALDATIRRYGLNDPFVVQYWRWLVGRADPVTGETVGGVLRGDLGYSRTGNQDVIDLLLHRLPATVELALWSIVPIIGVGIWLGVQAAVNHNKLIDQIARIFSIIGYSFPSFVFGLLVLLIFYARLEWFPPGRLTDWASQIVQSDAFTRYTQLNTVDALLNGRLDIFADALRHMVLPVLTLSYIQWALLLKITRSAMLEALRQDYVTTARAKGLAERDVINRHARPNALIPVATVSGLTIVGLLNGVVFTETIFNYPGIGSAAADAAVSLDVLTVLGFVLFTATLLIVTNLVVDVMYAFLDPRVRLS
ncbi:MAG TPA: ABC transporter permease [Anaerolineales bacterium]|nr:ABC transporter permease [Anaerolineales bacterium]